MKPVVKKKKKCYKCNESGHHIAQCDKNNGAHLQEENTDDARDFEENDLLSDYDLLSDTEENEIKPRSAKETRLSEMYACVCNDSLSNFSLQNWIVDSGASNHMCSNKSFFHRIKEGNFGNVVVANGNVLKSEGIGNVILTLGEGETLNEFELQNVLYVQKLNSNLISVRMITQQNINISFSGDF